MSGGERSGSVGDRYMATSSRVTVFGICNGAEQQAVLAGLARHVNFEVTASSESHQALIQRQTF